MNTDIPPIPKWIPGVVLAILVVIMLIITESAGNQERSLTPPARSTPLVTSPTAVTTPTEASLSAALATVTPFPDDNTKSDPYQTVRLAWFYKPPRNSMLPILADNYDAFILTHKDEPERDTLKSLGVTSPILAYLQLLEIKDPGSCTEEPQGNQVAFETGDFCRISEQHPDWFLLDQNGNRIMDGESVYMDPGNPEYQAFWLERAKVLQEQYHWDGIFIDNLEASLSKIYSKGAVPAKYPNDVTYQSAIEGFLKYIREGYFEPQRRPLLANIISVKDWGVWLHYQQYLDGAMIESFAVDWSNEYRSVADWEQQMAAIDRATARGKSTILVSWGDQSDADRQLFAFASYLLVSNEKVSFRYANDGDYREVLLFDNYSVDLGKPVGRRYRDGFSWRRDFTNGYVLVNPRKHKAEINLNP